MPIMAGAGSVPIRREDTVLGAVAAAAGCQIKMTSALKPVSQSLLCSPDSASARQPCRVYASSRLNTR
jgi:hypothetical protein